MRSRPVPHGIFLTGILGTIIFGIGTLYGQIGTIPISAEWGFTLTLISLLFTLSSFVSVKPQEVYHGSN